MNFFQIGWLIFLPAMTVADDPESFLPLSYPITRYSPTWENSPFNRKVLPTVSQISKIPDFGVSLILEGVVTDDSSGTTAYIRDSKNDKLLVVTSEADSSHPFTVENTEQHSDPREIKLTISNGNETALIEFPQDLLTQKITTPPPSLPHESLKPQPNPMAAKEKKDPVEDPTAAEKTNTETSPAATTAAATTPQPKVLPKRPGGPIRGPDKGRRIILPAR